MNRRQFAKSTLMATAMVSATSFAGIAGFDKPAARSMKKGINWGSIATGKTILEKFQAAKDAGFEGVEIMSHFDRNEVLKARDTTGLAIPSVCGTKHWKFLLSDPDPKIREEGVNALKVTIEDAAAYGADTIILVPGRVSETMSYDDCWNRSALEIKKVIPLAEKLKVKIALENVWNNFLLSPVETVTYLDQFKSHYIGFNFDVGNILIYGWPDQWIKIIGKRIAKVHIKEFSRKIAAKQGNSAGFGVKLLEGDVNWKVVMKALDDIGYTGWTTLEQPGGDTPEGLKDLCVRLINIQAS
jgi:L-ribulose-5-phosphate 3-epimerase